MRKLLYLAARLYPLHWRQRYGVEFEFLLDEVDPGWAAVWDVLLGGIKMHVKHSQMLLLVVAFGVAGGLAAGVMAFRTPDRFESKTRFRLDHPPAVSEAGRLEYYAPEVIVTAFSRANLAGIIERNKLYTKERASGQLHLEEIADRMRGDINVRRYANSGSVFDVGFSHPDPRVAQQVAQDLLSQLSTSKDPTSAKIHVIDRSTRPATSAGAPKSRGDGGFWLRRWRDARGHRLVAVSPPSAFDSHVAPCLPDFARRSGKGV
ncbi:MAG: hypothetical protein ACRDFA_09975 [bacterium]